MMPFPYCSVVGVKTLGFYNLSYSSILVLTIRNYQIKEKDLLMDPTEVSKPHLDPEETFIQDFIFFFFFFIPLLFERMEIVYDFEVVIMGLLSLY